MVMKTGLRVTHGRVRRSGGVTLLELMIVVVVIGLLAAIAYPSYQEQVRKSRRADGQGALLDTAQRLERCYTRFASYNDGNCNVALPDDSAEGYYQVSAAALNASSFTLTATPQNDQVNDAACGALTLTHTGIEGADGDVEVCW
jgi:type IV pilus assembly protein PilE